MRDGAGGGEAGGDHKERTLYLGQRRKLIKALEEADLSSSAHDWQGEGAATPTSLSGGVMGLGLWGSWGGSEVGFIHL